MSDTINKNVIKEIISELEDNFTVTQINQITKALDNVLSNYEMIITNCDNTSHNELLEDFLSAKQIEGRSAKTIKTYRTVISMLLDYAQTSAQNITVFTLRKFLSDKKSQGIADRTLEGYRNVFSSFFGWLFKEGLIDKNPCVNLGTIKYKKEIKYPFSNADIEKLRESCVKLRDKALMYFLLATGCRISEVTALNRTDVDLKQKECKVLGKGNKERIVYLDDVAVMWLEKYLESRTDNYEPLFISSHKQRMDNSTVRQMLHTLGDKAHVENVHPHRFRRTLATNLINRGMDIQEVAAILGHDNINTTMTYVYTDKVNVKNNYIKYAM